MSVGLSISDCIALAELITAAYQGWTKVPSEIRAFLSLVHELQTVAEGLEDNSAFENQVLLHREREFLCDWIVNTSNILEEVREIEKHDRSDVQFVQRLRWIFGRKLKPFAKSIYAQIDALKNFKQDLLLRSSTANSFANRIRFTEIEIACSADQLGLLEDSKGWSLHNLDNTQQGLVQGHGVGGS